MWVYLLHRTLWCRVSSLKECSMLKTSSIDSIFLNILCFNVCTATVPSHNAFPLFETSQNISCGNATDPVDRALLFLTCNIPTMQVSASGVAHFFSEKLPMYWRTAVWTVSLALCVTCVLKPHTQFYSCGLVGSFHNKAWRLLLLEPECRQPCDRDSAMKNKDITVEV